MIDADAPIMTASSRLTRAKTSRNWNFYFCFDLSNLFQFVKIYVEVTLSHNETEEIGWVMPKLNFKVVVTICAVSLFAVSSVNAQQLSSVGTWDTQRIGSLTLPSFDLRAGALAAFGERDIDAEIEEMAKLKLPNFAGVDMLRLRQQQKVPNTNLNPLSNIAVHNRDVEIETAPKPNTKTQYSVKAIQGSEPIRFGPEVRLARFNRNMVKKDLDNACKSNGSAQNCTETFEAAANVVAVLDPNKNSAAIWTGQTAKKVSDDLVKLNGTQEQVKNVIDTSVNVIGFMENQLQSNVSIAGGKESAALNLVKTSLNLMKTKPTPKRLVDDPANCGSDPNFDRCYNTPIIDALEQISLIGSPAINNRVIGPVMLKYNEQVAVAKANNTSVPVASTGSANVGVSVSATVPAATAAVVAATAVAVQAATRGWEERKASEARKHSEQRDAANTALTALQTTTQPQVVQQQQQQQQQPQQQNCNPQWQDC